MAKKNDTVFYSNRANRIRARVQTAHRDGSLTVEAMFYQNAAGKDAPGYLGFKYRMDPRVTPMFDGEGRRLG